MIINIIKCLFIIIVLGVLGLLGLKRYLDCNPIHLGGTGTAIPAHCTVPQERKERRLTMYKVERIKDALDFVCKHERRPPLSAETQALYEYALYQDLHNMWTGKKNDEVWLNAAVYYRIAAANGDYKANIRLQYLLSTNRVRYDGRSNLEEEGELSKLLADSLLATAYYKLFGHLEKRYGVEEPDGSRFGFLRKAADLGNREAQYVLGEYIRGIDDDETEAFRRELTKKLFKCSGEQGYGVAAYYLGIMYQQDKDYKNALLAHHQGIKGGKYNSAFLLSGGFSGKYNESNEVKYFALAPDLERAKRYEMIEDYLYHNEHLQPKVPDLDEIVPLPPAELPAWDGKIAFQRWFEGESPEKPSEALVKKLAAQAGLDWETGFPLKK
ncbi:hypothetical protein RO21_12015 [[Actinobacillus] muris]|uniref:DUF6396 domain-containing protein n=1 Tax=Muribacter muris TaxID=67855 RepID=A0A0J5P404_9PAST|nr:DUF6396 domain-containing protein [Muribacter muris]KMK50405.1 hypothetical protein RO21_12015 [[Actinobacillus] muris] [Muribacter muris]